ncbi:hypothetical protein [Saccharopolyspora gregorii]|uniref:hypothetical protein n=1 Tax=Saccharopolyspora gregorii TaxID=33914 RepID=UPI0031E93532
MPGELPFLTYAFAAFETRARWRAAGWVLVAAVVFTALRPWTNPDGETLNNAVWVTAFPALLGLWTGARRRLVAALRDRRSEPNASSTCWPSRCAPRSGRSWPRRCTTWSRTG